MSDILLDNTTHDITIIEGNLFLTDGIQAKRQHVKQRLQFFAAEWFLDNSKGIPYIQQVLVKNPNPVIIDSLLKNTIITTPGFRQLDQFELDLQPDTRVLTLTFQAQTEDGPVLFSEEIP